MTLLIDKNTRDIVFDADGMMVLIHDNETVAQNIRNILLTWRGEFFLDENHGTDYESVMGQVPTAELFELAKETIRDAVFQEPTVQQVDNIKVEYTSENRQITASFSGVLIDGSSISIEVTTDAN